MKNVCVKIMICLIIAAVFSGQSFAKEPLQPVTIQLNWVTNVQFAGILLAKERGWYEESGIDLTINGWKNDVQLIDDVISEKYQIGVAEGDVIIQARAKGKAVKGIGVQFQKTPLCLLSKKERGINTPAQMVGKKMGIVSPKAELMARVVLANQGLKYEDIIPVQIGWDIQPLINDEIDVFPAFMNNEPLVMKKKGYETNVIPAFQHGYDFYSGVYFVSDTMIEKQPDMIRKFLDATLHGWKEAFKDPAAAAKIIVEKYYPDGTISQQTESLNAFKYLATLGIGENLIGFMERSFWDKGIDLLYKFKQIDKKIPAEDVFTSEFLKAEFLKK